MRVLLVEDDDVRRASNRRRLEAQGYVALEASTGAEALELARAAATPLVIVLDYLLPEMCGYRLLRQIDAEPELVARHVFVVMSAHPALVDPPLPPLAGRWTRLVPKPVELARLREAVALATARPVRPSLSRGPSAGGRSSG